MGAKLPRILTPHTVTLKPHEGEGAYGDVYGTSRELWSVKVEEGAKLIRDRNGAETVSSARVYIRPEHMPVPLDSVVTLPSGREARVETVDTFHHPPAPEYYGLNLI